MTNTTPATVPRHVEHRRRSVVGVMAGDVWRILTRKEDRGPWTAARVLVGAVSFLFGFICVSKPSISAESASTGVKLATRFGLIFVVCALSLFGDGLIAWIRSAKERAGE